MLKTKAANKGPSNGPVSKFSFEHWARHHSPKKIMTGLPWQRKFKRPFHKKRALHVILHSCYGKTSFLQLPHYLAVDEILRRQARLHGVRLLGKSINSSHLHLLVKAPHAQKMADFLRSITGLIARRLLKAEKASAKGIQFWTGRPYSRLIDWGLDYSEIQKFTLLDEINSQISARQLKHFFSSA